MGYKFNQEDTDMTKLSRRSALRVLAAGAATASLASVARAATTHTVTISDFAFSPANLTISAGDRVVFVNNDGAPHTATANNGSFDTGRLNRGEQAALTFNSAGSFDYFCEFHRRMTGTITVA